MRRLIVVAALMLALAVTAAWAGSPHFIFVNSSISGNTISVSGKEAGLGNEENVHIVLSATAECINRGGNHPRAANKTSVFAADDFPVTNGKADFSLTATASFRPDCSPPMSVVFSDIRVTDTNNNISRSLGSLVRRVPVYDTSIDVDRQ